MVLSLVLASCAPAVVEEEGETIITEGEEVAGEVEVEEVEEAEEAPVTVEKGPQYGGTLSFHGYMTRNADTWDGNRSYAVALSLCDPFLERPIRGDVEKYGPRGTGEYHFMEHEYAGPEKVCVGDLLESWEVTSNPLGFIWHVRPGVYWTGKSVTPGVMARREFVADDIVYGLECHQDPDITPWSSRVDFLKSVTATDKYTVKIELNYWESCWVYRLCYGWGFGYYPREVREAPGGAAEWKNQVGTGPFILTDYIEGSSITYKKNPDYWRTSVIDGKEYKLPFIDNLVCYIIPDESTRVAAVRAGKLDIADRIGPVFRETLAKTCPDINGPSTWLHTVGYWIAFKHEDGVILPVEPFTDIRVRQAMSMALDRETMMEEAYIEGAVSNWPLFEEGAGYNLPIADLPADIRQYYEYNPEGAKELLAEVFGSPDADGYFFKTNIISGNVGYLLDIYDMVAHYWDEIGIELEIDLRETTVWQDLGKMREYDQMLVGSCCVANPAENMYCMFDPESVHNYQNWTDPHIIELITTACRTIDEDEANAMFREAGLYALEKMPGLTMPGPAWDIYWWPWVKNYYGEHAAGQYVWYPMQSTLWIDQDLKKEMGY